MFLCFYKYSWTPSTEACIQTDTSEQKDRYFRPKIQYDKSDSSTQRTPYYNIQWNWSHKCPFYGLCWKFKQSQHDANPFEFLLSLINLCLLCSWKCDKITSLCAISQNSIVSNLPSRFYDFSNVWLFCTLQYRLGAHDFYAFILYYRGLLTESKDTMNVSKERENYFRVMIIMNDVIAKCLRLEFVKGWNSNFEHQWNDDQKSGEQLLEVMKMRDKKFPFKKWEPQFKEGDSSKWDCTKLFFMLADDRGLSLARNIGVMRRIDDIKAIRNEITGHAAKPECSDSEFKNYVNKLKDSARTIGWENCLDEIEAVENQVLKTEDYRRIEKQLDQQHALESSISAANEKLEAITEKLSSMEISPPQGELLVNVFKCFRRLFDW